MYYVIWCIIMRQVHLQKSSFFNGKPNLPADLTTTVMNKITHFKNELKNNYLKVCIIFYFSLSMFSGLSRKDGRVGDQ